MTKYTYIGRDKVGTQVRGSMDADSPSAVGASLAGTGVMVTSVEPYSGAGAETSGGEDILKRFKERPVSADDVMLFSRQMSILERAGVPIRNALTGLEETTEKPAFKAILRDVRNSIESGRDLSSSMALHPKVFSPFYTSMIAIGEASGTLQQILQKLFGYLTFEKETRANIKSALRYPTMVLMAMAVGFVILTIFVIPAFAAVFKSLNAPLPLMTQILIGLSDGMVKLWPAVLGSVGLAIWWARRYIASPEGSYSWGRAVLKLPIVGPIIEKSTLARFCSSLAISLKSGMPMMQALTVVSATLENPFLGEAVDKVKQTVSRGESLSSSMRAAGIFSPLVLQMVSVGEESGELDEMLAETAHYYEDEVAYAIKGMSAAIEPIMLAILGGMVLLLALGIFLPMWSLSSAAIASTTH